MRRTPSGGKDNPAVVVLGHEDSEENFDLFVLSAS